MLNIYTIDMQPQQHNYKKIPRNALTHYAYNVHPIKTQNPKTLDKKAKPQTTQRKLMRKHKNNVMQMPEISIPAFIIPVLQITITVKYGSNGSKRALNEYYYNNIVKTPVQAAQEEREERAAERQAQWFADVVAELDAADQKRAAARTVQYRTTRNIQTRCGNAMT